MDSSVAPITRGEFLYRDVLLVDVGGELKRHSRAAEADIRRFLSGKEAKDQVGHWYEAQLIHYGLQRSKDKNAAKVRLQQALNQGKLKAAPPHLIHMEAQMRKEYAAALRKAKSLAKSPATSQGNKRALEEEEQQSSKKTKISITVDGVNIEIDQSVSAASKKQKATKSSVATQPTKPDVSKETKSATTKPKQSTATPKRTPALKGLQGNASESASKAPLPPASQPSATKNAAVKPKPKKARSEMVAQDDSTTIETTKKVPVKKEAAKKEPVKREPKVKNEPQLDHAPSYNDEDEMDTRPDVNEDQVSVIGVYDLYCPQLALQEPDHADKFRLFLCVDNEGGRIWAGFQLAWKSGIIKCDDIALRTPLSFGWRATEFNSDGRPNLRFGKGCFGEIVLTPGGTVEGLFHNLFTEQPLQFEGTRRPGPLWCGKSAYKFQQEWDQYPRDAYGR